MQLTVVDSQLAIPYHKDVPEHIPVMLKLKAEHWLFKLIRRLIMDIMKLYVLLARMRLEVRLLMIIGKSSRKLIVVIVLLVKFSQVHWTIKFSDSVQKLIHQV